MKKLSLAEALSFQPGHKLLQTVEYSPVVELYRAAKPQLPVIRSRQPEPLDFSHKITAGFL